MPFQRMDPGGKKRSPGKRGHQGNDSNAKRRDFPSIFREGGTQDRKKRRVGKESKNRLRGKKNEPDKRSSSWSGENKIIIIRDYRWSFNWRGEERGATNWRRIRDLQLTLGGRAGLGTLH